MPEQVSVRVLFFAAAREASGNVYSVELELPDPADTALLRYKKEKILPYLHNKHPYYT